MHRDVEGNLTVGSPHVQPTFDGPPAAPVLLRRQRAFTSDESQRRGASKGSRVDPLDGPHHFEPIDPLSSESTVVVDIVESVLEG